MTRVWHEGSWDAKGHPVGLPDEIDPSGDREQHVWHVVAFRHNWSPRWVSPVSSARTLLRTSFAYAKERGEPPPRWCWTEAERAPDPPEFQR